jgi:hypothetical protein
LRKVIDTATADFALGAAALAEQQRRDGQERDAARWTLEQHGKVSVLQGGKSMVVESAAKLPPVPFRVLDIDLRQNDKIRDADVHRLKDLTAL